MTWGQEKFLEIIKSIIHKREKWIGWTSSELKTWLCQRHKKMKRQAMDWDEIFVNHISNKKHIQNRKRTLKA